MSKQTAVKWLEKAFYKSAWSAYAESTGINNKWLIDEECLEGLFNQAKEMEREQIIDAFGVGCQVESTRLIGYQGMAEQYYNETYKGGEQ